MHTTGSKKIAICKVVVRIHKNVDYRSGLFYVKKGTFFDAF